MLWNTHEHHRKLNGWTHMYCNCICKWPGLLDKTTFTQHTLHVPNCGISTLVTYINTRKYKKTQITYRSQNKSLTLPHENSFGNMWGAYNIIWASSQAKPPIRSHLYLGWLSSSITAVYWLIGVITLFS